jgi:hypothetical protein
MAAVTLPDPFAVKVPTEAERDVPLMPAVCNTEIPFREALVKVPDCRRISPVTTGAVMEMASVEATSTSELDTT